jgi:hypothetical protein
MAAVGVTGGTLRSGAIEVDGGFHQRTRTDRIPLGLVAASVPNWRASTGLPGRNRLIAR